MLLCIMHIYSEICVEKNIIILRKIDLHAIEMHNGKKIFKIIFFFLSVIIISRKRFLDILWDNSHFQLPGKHKKKLNSISF